MEKHFNGPVIITDYPASIKAFYMRQNDDGKTVAAMDVLVPGIGEIIGGSQREERLENLQAKCAEFDIPEEHVWWYLDTRRFGSAKHAGFGMGFERLVMYVTGMTNIRDVIPFPRTPQKRRILKPTAMLRTKPSTETAPEAIASADSVDEIAAAADHRVGGSD